MKLPAFQFYPGDWLRDSVSGCSLAAQGLWLRLMILMHDAERYGYLCNNGLPIPSEQLARRCGCSLAEYEELLSELESAGVPRRTKDGIIYSKRMSEDADERAKNAERQRRHYETKKAKPNTKPNANPNTQPNANLTPTSQKPNNPSSSSSSCSDTNVSGDKPPPPENPSNGIWSTGVDLLIKSGIPDKEARSFLGGLAKKYGKGDLTTAIGITVAQQPASPLEYLTKVLENGNKPQANKFKSQAEINKATGEAVL